MRDRDALVSIARNRHLGRGSSSGPDGRARYAHRVAICVVDLPPVPERPDGGTKLTLASCLETLRMGGNL